MNLTRTMLATPVFLSPVIVSWILLETSENDAYSPSGDSLGIPLFTYMLIVFPITISWVGRINPGVLQRPDRWFWNRNKNLFCAVSLVLLLWPIGAFWIGFLLIGVATNSYATIFGSSLVLASVIGIRTFAIQSNHEAVDVTPEP